MTRDRTTLETCFTALSCAAWLGVLATGCRPTGANVSDTPPAMLPGPTLSGVPDATSSGVPDTVSSAADAVASSAAESLPNALSTLPRLPAADSQATDPSADNWQTETFGEETQWQLDQLAQKLAAVQPISAPTLSHLVIPAFRCNRLETQLQVVFQDSSLLVERPTTRGALNELSGADGLAKLLTQLLVVTDASATGRCKFKTFRVTPSDQGLATAARWDFLIESATAAVQQSGVWVCRWETTSSAQNHQRPRLQSIEIVDYERVTRLPPAPLFADCTEAVLGQNDSYHQQLAHGLDHWLRRLPLYYGIVATSYHGLAVGDANGDGLDDVYICQPGGVSGGLPNRLYLQRPDGTAHDVSAAAGVDWLTESHSALFVDLDNDADQDLVVATIAGLILAVNDGTGTFLPRVLKLLPEAPPLSMAAADFDNDGDLDIYACCYAPRISTAQTGRPLPYHDANNGSRNVLLRNDRDWRFSDVTQQVGLSQNNRRFSFACAWEDFDNDGDQDLYVANDFGRNNLYRNDDGKFTDIAGQAGVEDISAGMSVTWGDANNDGWIDLYVSNMWSSAGNRIAYQNRFLPAGTDSPTRGSFRRHARGNSLFLNASQPGPARFVDFSTDAGVTMAGWAWSSCFVDINNDGWQDLLVANGYITQDDDRDL